MRSYTRLASAISLRSVASSAGRPTLARTMAQIGAAERCANTPRIILLARDIDRSDGGSRWREISTRMSSGMARKADSLPALPRPLPLALALVEVLVLLVDELVEVRAFLRAGLASESSSAGAERGRGSQQQDARAG